MDPDSILKAISDGTRQRTLGVLRKHEFSVSELVEVLNQPQSTVSRHLRILRDARLIQDRRDGNTVLYSVAEPIGDGNGVDLAKRLLAWLAEQPLAGAIEARLGAVLAKRRDMSRRFFDRIGRQWDGLREESFGTTFHLEAFVALLPRRWSVADIGTGTGYLLPTLARHFDQVIGVEPVGRMLEAARRRLQLEHIERVELRQGDLADLPIADAAVDLAIAMLVLHHVPAPRDAVAELRRVVRPGGRVLIVEQSAHGHEAFHERMQDRWWGFDANEFSTLVAAAGFNQIESRRLVTVARDADAPDLFVVTGCRAAPGRD